MPTVTVRNLSEQAHRALEQRAAGRGTEAEMRAVLEDAVRPKTRRMLGSALAAFGGASAASWTSKSPAPRPPPMQRDSSSRSRHHYPRRGDAQDLSTSMSGPGAQFRLVA